MEITSFNQLFTEAARHGFRLNNLFQLENGMFRCNWRTQDWSGPFADDAKPFTAALSAYVLADLQAPLARRRELDEDAAKLVAMGQDPGPTDADLFG